MNDLDLGRELLSAARSSIEAGESAQIFRSRIEPLLARLGKVERARRGLTNVERELLEALHARLGKALGRVEFGLKENTVDHSLPALQDVKSIYQGAAFLEALMLEPIGPASA